VADDAANTVAPTASRATAGSAAAAAGVAERLPIEAAANEKPVLGAVTALRTYHAAKMIVQQAVQTLRRHAVTLVPGQ
jgi:hypothetical protein